MDPDFDGYPFEMYYWRAAVIIAVVRRLGSWKTEASLVRVQRGDYIADYGNCRRTTHWAIQSVVCGREHLYPANRYGQVIGTFEGL